MKMTFTLLRWAVVACLILTASCTMNRRHASLDITIHNGTATHISRVKLVWDEKELEVGVLPPGTSGTILDAGIPKSAKSDIATLNFVEDAPSQNPTNADQIQNRPGHSIPVKVAALKKLSPDRYDVTLSILSYSEVDLEISPKGN